MEPKSKETTISASLSTTSDPRSNDTTAGGTSGGSAREGGTTRDREYELRSSDRSHDRDRGYDRDRDRGYDRSRGYDRDRGPDRDRDDDRRYARGEDDRRYDEAPRQVWREAPLVIELDDEYDRDGRRYSRGMRDPQLCERDFTRGAERLANAVADGLSVYRRERDRSASRERDGAIRDFLPNLGDGLSEALRGASDVPRDVTRNSRVSTDRMNRQIRNMIRPFFRMYFR